MANLKITQVKSVIKRNSKQKKTIEAMGLGRPNYEVVLPDNAQTRGMINVVEHLIKVESIEN